MMAGMVNVNVIYTALHQSKRHAKWMALGGVLPELLYSAIAIFGVKLVKSNQQLFNGLKFVVIPVLIGLGIYYLLKKEADHAIEADKSKRNSFWKGLFLAMLNPQLITFWFGWLLIADNFLEFEQYTYVSPKLTFVIGTALGAYIMLRIFIYFTVRHREKILGWMKVKINMVVGGILILLGLIQLAAMLWL